MRRIGDTLCVFKMLGEIGTRIICFRAIHENTYVLVVGMYLLYTRVFSDVKETAAERVLSDQKLQK